MSVSHGCCVFVCLWLDHYLRQHGGCGATGATWLGGVATFTTARDRCIETIFVLVRPLLDVLSWYFGIQSMFLVIYAFIMMLSWLDDIRFNVIFIMMISVW